MTTNVVHSGISLSTKEDVALAVRQLETTVNAISQAGASGTPLGGGASGGLEGNINVQTVSAGKSPSATGADKVIATYSLPASAFDQAGRGLNIMACGSLANNVNAKTLKIIVNPTVTAIDGTVTDGTTIASFTSSSASAAGGWQLAANIFKYGAAGSNTQIALHEAAQSGSIVGALVTPSLLTFTESAVVNIVVTGNAATTAGDIVFNFLELNWMN